MFHALALVLSLSATKLETKTFTASPEGFLVTSTLVSGSKDAVLVDAYFSLPDAKKLADDIAATKKNLTTIYVSHAHPDHYFGLVVLKEKFPKAKLVALAATVEAIKKTAKAKADYWKGVYGDKVPATPVIPEALVGTTITVEGEKLEIHGGVQGDDKSNSYVWIPSLKTVIAGDIVYDGVHLWTAETNAADRKAWVKTLDEISALQPTVVVPGHQKPEKTGAPANLAFCKDYLTAYDQAVAGAKTAEDVQKTVKAKYADLGLEMVLEIGAKAQFKK